METEIDPPTSFPNKTKKHVIALYTIKYANANIRHFSELLQKHEDIKVNETTLLRWLKESDILSPKARRKTRKQQKQKLLQQKKQPLLTKR